MVFLEQSPNFSLFPRDSANTNCVSSFLKLNFPFLQVTVGSCSPVGPAFSLGIEAAMEGEALCGPCKP